MKKVLGIVMVAAVALFFATSANAYKREKVTVKSGDTKETVVVKETKNKTTVTAEKKTKETKEKAKIEVKGCNDKCHTAECGCTIKGKDVIKDKKGPLAKETVHFLYMEKNRDFIYVIKDDKVYRLKHKLSSGDKTILKKKVKGDPIVITSTYPLTVDQVENIAVVKDVELPATK